MSMDNRKKNFLLTPFNLLYRISPQADLSLLFRLRQGYRLNLENPRTYNEKLQWIKLYDHNPLMPVCCDKFAVREYIRSKGLGDLLNEIYWEGFRPEEIPFETLPDRFVIKATHGSAFNVICTDKEKLDQKKTIRLCRKWLKTKFLPCYGEWFYGMESPRIIVEKYLEGDGAQGLFDYKIFCFNGEPRMLYVDTWKDGRHAINAYDMDFHLLKGVQLGYPNDRETVIKKPEAWEEMKKIARRLAEDFLHVRVDLYYTKGRIFFGELTFTKGAGFGKIKPLEFDYLMGDWLKLPEKYDQRTGKRER